MVALDIHAAVPSLGIDHDFGILIIAHRARAIVNSRENIFMHKIAHMPDLVEADRLNGGRSNQRIPRFECVLLFAHGAFMICIAGCDNWGQNITAVTELHV